MAKIAQHVSISRFQFTIFSRLMMWLAILAVSAEGLQLTYCSSQNLAADSTPEVNTYQSSGNCQGVCSAGNYAFAITQGNDCWCSNYAPGQQLPTNQCSDTCPGYPFEYCGNAAKNLFSYYALVPLPSGTIQLSTSTSLSSPSPLSSSSSSSSTTALSDDSTATTPAPSSTSSASVTQSVITIGSSIVTRTVTFAPTGTSGSANLSASKSKLSTGSIVAIAVAVVVAAIVILVAIIVGFCCYKRKHRDSENVDDETQNNLHRNTSVLSKSGLLGGSSGSPHNSDSPHTAASASMAERRNSRLQIYDQRLNPQAFMQHDDGSRTSFQSMQDNRDYTRTLNVRNPDPVD